MMRTLSHVQGKGCLAHNNRCFKPKNVDSTRTPDNVIYIQQDIAEAYRNLFTDAVEQYNARQKRNDRKIVNGYFDHLFNHAPCGKVIESPNGQKSFYEDVVQIGTKDDTGVASPDAATAKLCLDEYMQGFSMRNPNFYVFNSVLHMDEATPHLHIDYIPIGHYTRGVPVQNGLAQALREMGYGGGKDAINRWRISERAVQGYGINHVCSVIPVKGEVITSKAIEDMCKEVALYVKIQIVMNFLSLGTVSKEDISKSSGFTLDKVNEIEEQMSSANA